MDIGITRSEVSSKEKEIPYDITYMWNLQYDTDELIYKAEIDSQTQGTDLWLSRGREMGEGWILNLGLAVAHYYIQKG